MPCVIYGYRLVMANRLMCLATCADRLLGTALDLPPSVCSSSTMTCRCRATNLPPSAERTCLGSPFARAACRRCIRRHRSVRWLARRECWRAMFPPKFREVSRWRRQGREDAVADLGMICRSAPASSMDNPTFSEQYTVTQRTLPTGHQPQSIDRQSQTSLGETYYQIREGSTEFIPSFKLM